MLKLIFYVIVLVALLYKARIRHSTSTVLNHWGNVARLVVVLSRLGGSDVALVSGFWYTSAGCRGLRTTLLRRGRQPSNHHHLIISPHHCLDVIQDSNMAFKLLRFGSRISLDRISTINISSAHITFKVRYFFFCLVFVLVALDASFLFLSFIYHVSFLICFNPYDTDCCVWKLHVWFVLVEPWINHESKKTNSVLQIHRRCVIKIYNKLDSGCRVLNKFRLPFRLLILSLLTRMLFDGLFYYECVGCALWIIFVLKQLVLKMFFNRSKL